MHKMFAHSRGNILIIRQFCHIVKDEGGSAHRLFNDVKPRGYLSACKSLSFARQKTSYWQGVDYQANTKARQNRRRKGCKLPEKRRATPHTRHGGKQEKRRTYNGGNRPHNAL